MLELINLLHGYLSKKADVSRLKRCYLTSGIEYLVLSDYLLDLKHFRCRLHVPFPKYRIPSKFRMITMLCRELSLNRILDIHWHGLKEFTVKDVNSSWSLGKQVVYFARVDFCD